MLVIGNGTYDRLFHNVHQEDIIGINTNENQTRNNHKTIL